MYLNFGVTSIGTQRIHTLAEQIYRTTVYESRDDEVVSYMQATAATAAAATDLLTSVYTENDCRK